MLATEREFQEIDRFSLGVLASHGVIDPFANTGTYMGFSGVPNAHKQQALVALELIAPAVHTLYFRTKLVAESLSN